MVFQMANLRRGEQVMTTAVTQMNEGRSGADGAYMVMMLGFLEEGSLPVTLKAVPRGL